VAGSKRVVLGLVTAKKTGQPAKLLYRMQLVASPCQDLVRIGLVANVPDQAVIWRVKDIMHRHGQFYGTQTRTRMAAHARTRIDNELADLVGNLLQVFNTELSQVDRRINIL
jgi:hypothetical protein